MSDTHFKPATKVIIQRGKDPDAKNMTIYFAMEVGTYTNLVLQEADMLAGTKPDDFPTETPIKSGGQVSLDYKQPLREDVINYLYDVNIDGKTAMTFSLIPGPKGGFAVYGVWINGQLQKTGDSYIKFVNDPNGPYWALMIPADLTL